MTTLTTTEKDAIRDALKTYVDRYPSQNKAAASLRSISAGTMSTVLNAKYENISDDMFRNIATQVGLKQDNTHKVCETSALKDLLFVMNDAKKYQNVLWAVGNAGCGKTTSIEVCMAENKNVFRTLCSEDMTRGEFVREMARSVGVSTDGHTIRHSLDMILDALSQIEEPLLAFDEADKVRDSILLYFITIFNRLEDKCGIVFLSTPYMVKRFESGIRCNKKGYRELWSRIGCKIYMIAENTNIDVYNVCQGNMLSSEAAISDVLEDAKASQFDMRRVKRAIHKQKRKASIQK